jgi:hypothetical protein
LPAPASTKQTVNTAVGYRDIFVAAARRGTRKTGRAAAHSGVRRA